VNFTDFAGLQRSTLYLLGFISAVKAGALVGVAFSLSTGIVSLIDGNDDWRTALVLGLLAAVVRAVVAWMHQVVSVRALLGAKERLRAELAEAVVETDGASVGSTTTLATRGLDELDNYYKVFLPALINAATLPLLVGVVILFSDWVSAVIVVLTVPLVPLFMALIGMHTSERVAAATDALSRLSDHLVELARGLPVLVGLGRAKEQTGALREISDQFRVKTLSTLRTAFLSSLALELIATISVALVAVTIGVRLVGGDMALGVGLFVLLLAPECFSPFRDVGAGFHASDEGREALRRVTDVISRDRGRSLVARDPARTVAVSDVTVTYSARNEPAIAALSFTAEPHTITLVNGPSGAGKSTVLAALTGRLRDGLDSTVVTGRISGIDPDSVAWLPQHPRTVSDTVAEEIRLYGREIPDSAAVAEAVAQRLGLADRLTENPGVLSPGELRRVAFGAVLMRVAAGATVVILDEPTAHLDRDSARIVIGAISELRKHTTVILASHDEAVRALADHTVELTVNASPRERAVTAELAESWSSQPLVSDDGALTAPADQRTPESHDDHRTGRRENLNRRALRELFVFLRPQRGKFIAAALLGVGASLSAIALTSLSAWLIVRASEQPPIMYLLVAIVGVRFFGIGRAVLRYSERLVLHDAVFAALTKLRMRLWHGLAAAGTTNRAVLGGGSALTRLVRDADEVRDLSVRVVQPMLVGIVTTVVIVLGLGWLYPPLLPLFVALAVTGVLIAPFVALLTDRAASRGEQVLRSRVATRFAALVAASGQLKVNGVDRIVRGELRELDARATASAQRAAGATGLGAAVAIAACGFTAVLVIPLTLGAVVSGQVSGETLAILVLTPLGLIEVLLDLVGAVQQWPVLRDVLMSVAETSNAPARREGTREAPSPVTDLVLRDVSAGWPGVRSPVFENLDARVRRGQWLVVTGPSGSGKSTLLSVLLGHLAIRSGQYLLNGQDTSEMTTASLRRAVSWCPQEGHLFNSTVRANLLIARARGDAPTEQELLKVLERVGLGPLVERLPLGLDNRIGVEGGHLSGGERQRLAVARTLLARADVVLLDEPTAHVDVDGAESLMTDLEQALAGTLTVLVTHHSIGLSHDAVRIQLKEYVPAEGR
jgi:ATP-binding cassette subfamily C protein CydCD